MGRMTSVLIPLVQGISPTLPNCSPRGACVLIPLNSGHQSDHRRCNPRKNRGDSCLNPFEFGHQSGPCQLRVAESAASCFESGHRSGILWFRGLEVLTLDSPDSQMTAKKGLNPFWFRASVRS